MKQTIKRLLAVLLCFSMIYIPSFSASASTELISITEDLTQLTEVEGWSVTATSAAKSTAGLVLGEGYKIDQGAETITKSGGSKSTVTVSKVFDNKFVDAEKATVTSVKEFQGKYKLSFDFSMVNEAVEGESEPFYIMLIGGYDASCNFVNSLELRIKPASVQLVDSGKLNVSFADDGDEDHSIDLVIDTVSKAYTVSIDEAASKSRTLNNADIDFMNGFTISNMERMAESSYINLKKVVLEEVESDYNTASEATKTVLANLPDKLAENVKAVTEETLTLDQTEGVTWTSSDENVINPTTGVVTRADEDKIVTLTAKVDLENNGGVYEKTYTMTVLKAEQITPPGGGEDDDEDIPVVNGFISTEDLTQLTEVEGWSVSATSAANSTAGLVLGEGYKIDQGDETITKAGGGKSTVTVSKVFDNKIVDAENATVTSVKEFQGKYRLSIDFSMVNEAVEGESTPFYLMYIGGNDASGNFVNSLELRINPTAVQLKDSGSSSVKYTDDGDKDHTIDLVIDTISKTYSISIDGGNSIERSLKDVELDSIKCFTISNMERMAASSYFNFKKVVLEEVESDYNTASEETKAVVAQLPEKLTDNVNEVTENLAINPINGVTWISSDEAVISPTGVVTRAAEDKVVTLTATVDLENNGGVYEKTYTMTVLKDEQIIPPEGGEDDDDDIPVVPGLISIEEDFSKYPSVDMIPNTSVITESTPITTRVKTGEKGIEILHTGSEHGGGTNKVNVPVINHGIEGSFDFDKDNRTALRINRFTGNFKISILFNTNALNSYKVQDVNFNDVSISSYYMLNVGQMIDYEEPETVNQQIFSRIYDTGAKIMNSSSSGSNTLSSTVFSYDNSKEFHKMELTFDTDKSSVVIEMDDAKTVTGKIKGIEGEPVEYLNSILVYGWQRAQKGTYFNLKNVKVEYVTENTALEEARDLLGEFAPSLVSNPYEVTENITLPEGENITWSSSNDEVISINELTAVVKRWYTDRDVVLTATYKKDNIVLMKDYTLTVKAQDNQSYDELLNITIADGDSTDDWTEISESMNPAGAVSVGNDGLLVTKILVAEQADAEGKDPEYTVERTLYVKEDLYSDANSDLYSAGFSGIYSFGVDLTSNVSGNVPVRVGIGGYDKGNFSSAFNLAVTGNGIEAEYMGETLEKTIRLYYGETKGKTFDFDFIVDTINERFWVLLDGKLVTEALEFYDMSSSYKFDTMRVILDKNTALNDSVAVNNISLTELSKNPVADKENLISLMNSLDIKTITNDSPKAVESINTLPEVLNNVYIKWECNSDALDFETGKVIFDALPEDVVVTALMSANGVSVRKDFHLTVRAAESDGEMLDYLTNYLDKEITLQDIGDIRYNICLPESFMGMNITWKSNSDLIDNTGVINRNSVVTAPTPVKLTAEIEYGGKNYTKDYQYTISPMSGENVLYSGTTVPEAFNVSGKNVVVTNTSHTYLKLSQTGCNDGEVNFVDANGKAFLKLFVLNNTYHFDYKNSDYKQYQMPAGKTVDFEIVVMPEKDKFAVWADGERIIDYADFINGVDNFAAITASGTGLTVEKAEVTVDDYGMLDINFDNINYFNGLNKRVLKENVTLERSVLTPARVEWKSSDTSLVTDNGVITVPEIHDFATMTVTLYNTENANVYKAKSIDVAVACDKSKNHIPGATIKASTPTLTGFEIESISDENFDTSFALLSANKMPAITVDFGKELYLNGFYINEDFGLYDSGIKKYTLSYSLNGNSWTDLKSGEITNTASNYIDFEITKVRYLKLTVTESDEKTVYINELEAYFNASPDEIIKYDIDSVELNLGSVVTENITLPQTGPQGTGFVWTSSNPAVISTTGVVTRPANGTNVTLTVSASYNGTQYTKKFTAYVSGTNENGGTVIGGGAAGGSGGGGGASGGGAGGGNKTTDSTVPGFVETEPTEPSVTPDETVTFKDVPATHWAFEAINTLRELGIINGDGAGNFNPSSPVTREQFIKMLVEASGIELSANESKFEDVDSAMWYAPYIQTGVDAGLINGLSSTEFGVGREIKRCDMAVMLYRILKSMENEFETDETLFADDGEIPQYAKKAVYTVRSAGIIEGYNNMFNPNDSLTRAEAATVLLKFMELIQ